MTIRFCYSNDSDTKTGSEVRTAGFQKTVVPA